ncbi:MAG: PAS domain-containing protein [Bacteroidales bacterium]|nr:PAS domain-containing protein [Bacteroidales bacterium]
MAIFWLIYAWFQKTRRRQLRDEILEWKYLLGNIPDLIMKLDEKGIIQYISPAALLYFKKIPDEYLGLPIEKVLISEGFQQIEKSSLHALLKERQAQIIESYMINDEKRKHLEIRLIPGPPGQNSPSRHICLIRDITKRKESEIKLVQAKLKAQESDRLKSAFLANMSHEIRTPLNAIIGFTQIIMEEELTEEEKSRYSTYIYQNSNQLINLITDIIDISKLESNQLKIKDSTFNLNQELDEIKEIIENEKKKKKKHISLMLDKEWKDDQAEFTTDPYRLRQILINLLVNALKFTSKGFIHFGYKSLEDDKVLFWVKDSGVGIDPSKKEEVFMYFRQLENTFDKPVAGTGLGLAISRNLVNLMGGTIWVESEPGKGATFYFTLPRKKS